MNTFYDEDDARAWLNTYIAKCFQDGGKTVFLPQLTLGEVRVEEFRDPLCWRMTVVNEGDVEEVEVKIPGILCRNMLPPITRKLSPKDKGTIRNLRQFVKVTGLGVLVYGEFQKKIEEIERLFAEAVKPRIVKSLTFHEYEGEYAIDAHCRYFTDRRVAPMVKHQGFSDVVDPEHRLEVARGEDFVQGPDNVVQYLTLVTEDGKERFEAISPGDFKNGDIVEIRVSFMCFPLYEGGCKVVPTLRSLILLSNHARKAAHETMVQKQGSQAPTASGLGSAPGGASVRNAGSLKRKFIQLTYTE
ncbi:hypothetical protein EST38_g13049 [Candolleomyces aberdarensis]|uniref:Uncharacterized protein n=1 Tax=Candolleomyces aberdarensis TaxID=2316362 RepID=A0A4Q2D224_9AGAR|nr:hypothetical protein EST38_g13049 [Candolleomyces aberdarensis]